MVLSLKGRSVAVLGVGTGMGRSISLALARLGATLFLASRSVDRVSRICAEAVALGGGCHYYKADVTKWDELKNLSKALEEAHGGVTDLVYNAGGYFSLDTLEEIEEDYFDAAIDVNVKGLFLSVKAFLPQIRRSRGTIVAVAASPATILAGNVAYAASKGGLIWMVKRMAKELAGDGVRVACISPGPTAHDEAPLETSAARLRSWEPHLASDVGWAAALLISGAFPRLTGECIVLDGGLSIP